MLFETRYWSLLWVISVVAADSTFRFGVVFSSNGGFKLPEIKDGYEFIFDHVNDHIKLNDDKLGKENASYSFNFTFIARDSRGDATLQEQYVKELLEDEKVHFLGGSHPTVAEMEMRLSNASGVLNYQCCVGPDVLYELDFPRVFGIQASNTQYTKTLIRALELREVGKTAFVYQEDRLFERTTCEAGIGFHQETKRVQTIDDAVIRTFNGTTLDPDFFTNVAREMKELKVEAVFACIPQENGTALVNAFHEEKYSLRAFFLTVGPTDQDWVDDFTPFVSRSDDLLSAAQWHRDLKYEDGFFGNTSNYASVYAEHYLSKPLYTAAGASAVGLTLWQSIQKAFQFCDISETKGEVDALLNDADAISCDDGKRLTGYERIVETLADLETNTFFGRVKFNQYRRNVGLDPVTTQVRKVVTQRNEEFRTIYSVLPDKVAGRLLRYPATNQYREKCKPGYFKGDDSFDPCKACPKGEVSDRMDANHCESCPIGYWMNATGQSECHPCPAGTRTDIKGAKYITDCMCNMGYFSPTGEDGVECQVCMKGAVCEGGRQPPVPEKGYWGNFSKIAEVYECDPTENCLGGLENSCADGYTGRLCSSCEDGYFSVVQQCVSCWSATAIVLACALLLFGWYVINVYVSKSVPSLEMILGWAQLANIIGDINLNWTPMVTKMFGVANILDFDVDILEPSCLFNWGFKHNFITQLCLPVVMTFMGCSGYLASAAAFILLRKGWLRIDGRRQWVLSCLIDIPENEDQLKEKWDMTIATFLASVDITYVTIAKYCFDVFKCVNVAGDKVLREEPDVVCYDSSHKFLMVMASLGILFYVLGYLAYASWKLYDLASRGCFSNPTDVRRFGFIYKKYELDYNFTPAIVILRKLCFVLVLVYMNNPAFQIGAIAIIINASLMIHVYTAPYVDTYLDVLFSFLLLALMFEAFGGLMFYSENLPQANREILEWIIMVSLFMLIIVFLVFFVKEMTTKYKARFVMKMYRDYARLITAKDVENEVSVSGSWGLKPIMQRLASRKENEDISFELLETFDPGFVYQALRADSSYIKQWDKLTRLLKEFMSDQSDTSYLSMKRTAKFWRKLVDRFPELVDFLAVADEETRQKFVDVATNLYRNFYLTKKVTRLPLIDITNWRDYAPMAQWLAIAPEEDRKFFLEFVSMMFRASGQTDAADTLAAKLENGGKDPHISRRPSLGSLSTKKRKDLTIQIRDGDPFYHRALDRRPSDIGTSRRNSFEPRPSVSHSSSLGTAEDPRPSRGSSGRSQLLENVQEDKDQPDSSPREEIQLAESSGQANGDSKSLRKTKSVVFKLEIKEESSPPSSS